MSRRQNELNWALERLRGPAPKSQEPPAIPTMADIVELERQRIAAQDREREQRYTERWKPEMNSDGSITYRKV